MSRDPNAVNVSGPLLVDAAREVMEVLGRHFDKGLGPEIASHLLVALGVDLYRANMGDQGAVPLLSRTIEMRMSRPLGFWGASAGETRGNVAMPDVEGMGRPN